MKTFDERKQNVQAYMAAIRSRRKTITTVTSLTMILLVLALVLFVPYSTTPPSTQKYQNHSYYDLIRKINLTTFKPPEHLNNFEALKEAFLDGIGGTMLNKNENMDYMAPSATMSAQPDNILNDPGEYVEVTDNQVQGVIEGDIFKRSTEYIYYLQGLKLSVYAIAQEESCLVGSFAVSAERYDRNDQGGESEKISEPMAYATATEMYLSQDCTTVTIVMQCYTREMGTTTTLVSLDVTDPAAIRETNRVYMSGAYMSSRMVDGRLLVMSRYHITTDKVDFDDPTTFVPQVGTEGNLELVAPENIQSPEELSHLTYTVISVVDEKTLNIQDSAAFLSFSDNIYVSNNNIFVTRSFTQELELGSWQNMTEISAMSYAGEGLRHLGSVQVAGFVKNQYSMDESNGVLRVVTSTNGFISEVKGETTVARRLRNASLYCISLENLSVIASVENFAPDGEQAESVRFDGHMAYVCTAEVVTLTDPVYFFDLSDLQNITYTDTGTIDGYSTSLIQLGDGYLLGIGYGDSRQLKIEVYEELDGKVVSVCAYEMDASFPLEYKCYYIDRENDLIGLPVRDYEEGNRYILLHFDGYGLNCVATAGWSGDSNDVRATIIDGYLYVLSQIFVVKQVW